MVDVMDRRLTRSASNELRLRLQAQSGLGLRSGRELPSTGIYSNGPPHQDPQEQQQQQQQQHRQHGSIGQGGQQEPHQQQQQQQQQQQDGVNTGEDAPYQRNTSEEMFLNTVINQSLVPGTPMIEAASLEFLDNGPQPPAQARPIPQDNTPRGDSEELFQNFLSANVEPANGNQAGADPSAANDGSDQRGNLQSEGQNGAVWNTDQPNLETDAFLPDDDDVLNVSNEHKSPTPRNNSLTRERGRSVGSSPLGPAKENNSSLPTTRSSSKRMSELRRQFSQMGGPSEAPPDGNAESPLGPLTPGASSLNENLNDGSPKAGSNLKSSRPQSLGDSILSSASPVNYSQRVQQQADHQNHQISDAVDLLRGSIERRKSQLKQQQPPNQTQQQLDQPQDHPNPSVSDAVGGLKGSLERKKTQTKQQQGNQKQQWRNEQNPQQQQNQNQNQPLVHNQQQQQQQQRSKIGPQGTPRQEDVVGRAQDLREQLAMETDPGLLFPGQLMQDNILHAQSPTTSSAAAASHSAGLATSDGPSNSSLSGQRHGMKRGNGEVYENGTANLSQKPERLTRAGSITSALEPVYPHELDGATKKRRVERVRKMNEAKVRGHAPPMPADLQAALKRCDNLEKELRSLKHYLSFMNRKDSEQTKRIEELEEENEELRQSQNRLQELERVPGKRERDVGGGKRTNASLPGYGNARR